MKISSLDCFPVKLAFKEPFVIANGVFTDLFYVIVRLGTDCGIVGYGEAIPAWEVTGETQFSVIDALGHLCEANKTGFDLIGRRIGSLDEVRGLVSDLNPEDRPQILAGAPSAKAALEGAVLDALGKHLDQPVYEIIGGVAQDVPVAEVIGIYPVGETLARVELALKRGPGVLKLKVGVPDVGGLPGHDRDVEVVKATRKILDSRGIGTRLVADANQGFATLDRTVAFARRVEGCLAWLEQPILADDRLGFRKIKRNCDIPLMADEAVHGCGDAKLLLELGGVDYLNLKLMKTGGMLEALRIAELALSHGVLCQMGSMLENQIGCAAAAHTYLCSKNIVTTELCSLGMLREHIGSGIEVLDGRIRLSAGPGLGIEVDEGEIADHLIGPDDSLTYRNTKRNFGL